MSDQEDENARLKRELAARVIRAMGPRSPFWNCTLCGAAKTTPLEFEHKPECLLADTPKPPALVPQLQHKHFYSLEVQHAEMLAALHAAANWFTAPNDSRTAFPLQQIADAIAKAEARP